MLFNPSPNKNRPCDVERLQQRRRERRSGNRRQHSRLVIPRHHRPCRGEDERLLILRAYRDRAEQQEDE
jgi:hypothetical protein